MKLANTLGLTIAALHRPHYTEGTLVGYMQQRLFVAGWVVWNGGFDYRGRKYRTDISPTRETIKAVLEKLSCA